MYIYVYSKSYVSRKAKMSCNLEWIDYFFFLHFCLSVLISFFLTMNSYLEFFGCKCRRRDNKLVQQKYNIPKQMYYMKPYRITNFFSVLRTKPDGQSFTSLNLMPIFSNPISPIWKEFQPICRPARLKESSWNNQGFHIHVLVINRSSAGSYHTIFTPFACWF